MKPEFFRHEGLQELEIQHPGSYPMFVFEGLWTLCDSQGCFPFKPRQIKLDILPFLNFDMAKTLGILVDAGYIVRYQADGHEYGYVPTFLKHQKLTGKELDAGGRCPKPPVVDRSENHKEPIKTLSEEVLDTTRNVSGTYLEPIQTLSGEVPDSQEREREREKEGKKEESARTNHADPVVHEYRSTKPPSPYSPIPVPTTTAAQPDSRWIATEFFSMWSIKTARLVGPQNRDYQLAHELLTSLGGSLTSQLQEEVHAAISKYLEDWKQFWFARRGSAPNHKPDWSFRGFAGHYAELVAPEHAAAPDDDWESDPRVIALARQG